MITTRAPDGANKNVLYLLKTLEHRRATMCILNEADDLNVLQQMLQEYSRPSMCFSTCSLMWPLCFDLWPQLVQKYPSVRFSIIDWICAIVSGSIIEFSFVCIGTIFLSTILSSHFSCDIFVDLSVMICFWFDSVWLVHHGWRTALLWNRNSLILRMMIISWHCLYWDDGT